MVLHIDSDTAYLVLSKVKSRITDYYYLLDNLSKLPTPRLNGIILVECKVLRNVVSSLVEVETGGVFHNAKL